MTWRCSSPPSSSLTTLTAASGVSGGKPISSAKPYHPPTRLMPTLSNAATGEGEGEGEGDAEMMVGQPGYPAHFTKGSLIQLANGEMKKVEDLETEDFIRSAEFSPDVRIDHSPVVKLDPVPATGSVLLSFSVGKQRIQVTVEAAMEHPFFVFGQGWSSSSPELTQTRYRLQCQQLKVGDVCISLTHKLPPARLTTSAEETRATPSKQVVFHDTPSIIRINPESPPLSRVTAETETSETTTKLTQSLSPSTPSSSSTVSVMVSVTTSSSAPSSTPTSPSTDSLELKRRWQGATENRNHKPKTVKTGDDY